MMKKLNGKELVKYSIDASLKCKKISKVLISSNDKKSLKILKKNYASNNKVLFHNREEKLSLFNTSITDTLKACIKFLQNKNLKFDYVYLINTSFPFISENDLNNSFNILDFFKLDRVIGVLKETNNFYLHNGKTLNQINDNSYLRLEKNEIYTEPGSLSIFNKRNMFKKKMKTGHIILEKFSCFQIKDETDFNIAKTLNKIRINQRVF